MGETSKPEDVKSPQEIEEGIKSTPTVTWDPFTVLPREIYLEIFDKLEKPIDKQNFMNAHVKFYDLFKSERTVFLFEKVIGVEELLDIDSLGTGCESPEYPNSKDLHNCRLVCRHWDRGIQKLFQLYSGYFSLDKGDEIWKPGMYLEASRYEPEPEPGTCFYYYETKEVETHLERFPLTHPPSKNPFLSRSVTLSPCLFREDNAGNIKRYRKAVGALLERYGQHIWHCRVEIKIWTKLEPEAYHVIANWLGLMPQLKTLRVRYDSPLSRPLTDSELKEIQDIKLHQPEMPNLVLLNSSYLPPIVFNKLFKNLWNLETFQIRVLGRGELSSLKDFILPTNRENLKEAFLTVKGLQDFNYLKNTEAFPLLETLVIDLEFENHTEACIKAYSEWPEWKLFFEILEEKFPSVSELTIRLPKAVFYEDKMEAINQSLESRLNLPKLKYLWVALPNKCSLDFLLPCQALKELEIVLEYSKRDFEEADDLISKEQINFNMDLGDMQDSNIWDKFPKLDLLLIDTTNDCCEEISKYYYEKKGEGVKKYHETVHLHSE